jgi:ABC-type uncharacterized transport system, duplicated ATPase component
MKGNGVLLEVQDVKKHFPIRGGVLSRVVASVKAVDGVSFAIKKGESWGWWGSRERQDHGGPHPSAPH